MRHGGYSASEPFDYNGLPTGGYSGRTELGPPPEGDERLRPECGTIIDDLLHEMAKLDPNEDHSIADRLLIAAIRRMANGCCGPVVQEQAERFIAAYERVEKWYA